MIDPSFPTETSNSGRHFNPRNTFGEFVVGTGNQFAHAASIAAADQPGDTYNPLFIYGGGGGRQSRLAPPLGPPPARPRGGRGRGIFMSVRRCAHRALGAVRDNPLREWQATL